MNHKNKTFSFLKKHLAFIIGAIVFSPFLYHSASISYVKKDRCSSLKKETSSIHSQEKVSPQENNYPNTYSFQHTLPAPLHELSEEEKYNFRGARILESREFQEPQLHATIRQRILDTGFKYPYIRTEEMIDPDTGNLIARLEMVANQIVVTLPKEKDPNTFLKEFGSYATAIIPISKSLPIYQLTLNQTSLESLPSALQEIRKYAAQGIFGEPDHIAHACAAPRNYGYTYQWGLWKNSCSQDPILREFFLERYRLHYQTWIYNSMTGDVVSAEEKNQLQQQPRLKDQNNKTTTTFSNNITGATAISGHLIHQNNDRFSTTRGINAEEGWDVRTSAKSVIVAVLDSGIRYTHQNLKNNIWNNPKPDPVLHDLHGINLIDGTGDPLETPENGDGHGTHLAGIIGGEEGENLGVAGVAWKVQLMACKWMDADGNGSFSDAIRGFDYAKEHGASIINCSFRWSVTTADHYFDPITYKTIQKETTIFNLIDEQTHNAAKEEIKSLCDQGIIVVAAAGNEAYSLDTPNPYSGDMVQNYPACFSKELDNVISVAATDYVEREISDQEGGAESPNNREGLAYYTSYGGKSISIAAPGVAILSTYHLADDSYAFWGGSSMATPFVTGALALLKAQYPNASPKALIHHVMATADHLPTLEGNVQSGRLNLAKALHTPLTKEIVTN